MKTLMRSCKPAAILLGVLTLILGVIYPLLIFGIGELFFHKEAKGSFLSYKGKLVGSKLIGQGFSQKEYFHPRPSAAGKEGYNGASSSGSNLGPTSEELVEIIKERIAAYRIEHGVAQHIPVPADAVTTSASGLDPHISIENAYLQADRVAKARGITVDTVKNLIDQHTEFPLFGFLGQTRVHVLTLNIALDEEREEKKLITEETLQGSLLE